MERICAPELLDQLPPEDEGAIGSRRDLRRLNWWMGNAGTMAEALNRFLPNKPALELIEIGAGDGDFLANVLDRVSGRNGTRRTATLLDQQELLTEKTAQRINVAGWEPKAIKADVFDWFNETTERFDAVLANLFLHHFTDEQLAALFKAICDRTDLFVSIEPSRARVSIFTKIFFWAIGCNAVTRHDAKVSIRAGFAGKELTGLWPDNTGWICEERRAGFSSHLFIARKTRAHGVTRLTSAV